MNRVELISAMAEKSGISKKDAEKALNAFMDTVKEELQAGQKVQLVGFGTFEVTTRAARESTNPQTGAKMQLSAKKTPKFRAGKPLKDAVQ